MFSKFQKTKCTIFLINVSSLNFRQIPVKTQIVNNSEVNNLHRFVYVTKTWIYNLHLLLLCIKTLEISFDDFFFYKHLKLELNYKLLKIRKTVNNLVEIKNW